MLGVARAQPSPAGATIEWRQGNALSIPFQDAEFDAVLCQNGLQFMPDRPVALREMLRVLKSARRLVLSVNGYEYASEAIQETVARFLGPDAAALYQEPFVMDDAEALARLFDGLGYQSVKITRETITAHYRRPTFSSPDGGRRRRWVTDSKTLTATRQRVSPVVG